MGLNHSIGSRSVCLICEHSKGHSCRFSAFQSAERAGCKVSWVGIGYFHTLVQFQKIIFHEKDLSPDCDIERLGETERNRSNRFRIRSYVVSYESVAPSHRLRKQTLFVIEDKRNSIHLLLDHKGESLFTPVPSSLNPLEHMLGSVCFIQA